MDDKTFKKRKLLSQKETAIFIEVWRSKISELRGSRKNNHILKEMVADLSKNGIFLSVEEVRTRINNLTKRLNERLNAILYNYSNQRLRL